MYLLHRVATVVPKTTKHRLLETPPWVLPNAVAVGSTLNEL